MEYKSKLVLVEKPVKNVALLTLNNPPLNLVTLELSAELRETLFKLERDDEVRVVVLMALLPPFVGGKVAEGGEIDLIVLESGLHLLEGTVDLTAFHGGYRSFFLKSVGQTIWMLQWFS